MTKDRWKGIEDPELLAALQEIEHDMGVVADRFRTGYEIHGDLQHWIAEGDYDREHCAGILKHGVNTAIAFELLNKGISSGNSLSPTRQRVSGLLYGAVAPEALL